MFRCLSTFLVAIAIWLTASVHAHAADPADSQPPNRLGLCAACHGERGIANERNVPNLAGQNLEYMKIAIHQYQQGQRNVAAMRAALGMLNAADVDQVLRWYATQPPAQPSR
ncbi:MAG: c-type cytochrome [Rudaea sp.]